MPDYSVHMAVPNGDEPEQVLAKAESLRGSHVVSFREFFPPPLVQAHSRFADIDRLLAALPVQLGDEQNVDAKATHSIRLISADRAARFGALSIDTATGTLALANALEALRNEPLSKRSNRSNCNRAARPTAFLT